MHIYYGTGAIGVQVTTAYISPEGDIFCDYVTNYDKTYRILTGTLYRKSGTVNYEFTGISSIFLY